MYADPGMKARGGVLTLKNNVSSGPYSFDNVDLSPMVIKGGADMDVFAEVQDNVWPQAVDGKLFWVDGVWRDLSWWNGHPQVSGDTSA